MQEPGTIKEAPPGASGAGEPIERRLESAVIETNRAVQEAARAIELLAASISALYGGGVDADL